MTDAEAGLDREAGADDWSMGTPGHVGLPSRAEPEPDWNEAIDRWGRLHGSMWCCYSF